MSSLNVIEVMKLEKIFGMESGYVLDFSNNKFQAFVITCTNKNIYDKVYETSGTSKANRLRIFWHIEKDFVVAKLTSSMLEYWKEQGRLSGKIINSQGQDLFNECTAIAERLSGEQPNRSLTEDEFIAMQFKNISLDNLGLEHVFTEVLNQRLMEIKSCLNARASLAVIFLCGSTLEGILLGTASKYPKQFNESKSSPKKDNKVLPFWDWSLSSLIDVANDIGLLKEDVKKYSHTLRDFRNYIHPYQQMSSNFEPHFHTAKISWQVLQAAIYEMSNYKP